MQGVIFSLLSSLVLLLLTKKSQDLEVVGIIAIGVAKGKADLVLLLGA